MGKDAISSWESLQNGVVEGKVGEYYVDKNKAREIAEKRKLIMEPQTKCVRVFDEPSLSLTDEPGILNASSKKSNANKKPKTGPSLTDIEDGPPITTSVAKKEK